MAISVVEPISPAIERTRWILFRPFRIEKWFALGFCAWLASFGEGGYRFNVSTPYGGGPRPRQPQPQPQPQPGPAGRGMPPEIRVALEWVQTHIPLVLGIAAGVLVLSLAIGLLLSWLKARGMFMFLDGVAHDGARIGPAWGEYRREGNSLFRFLFAFGIALYAAFLLVFALGMVLAYPDLRAWRFGPGATAALVVTVPTSLVLGLTGAVVQVFLRDFVVPIMYLRRVPVMEGWSTFRRELLRGRKGTFAVYLLFQLLMGLVLGMIGFGLFCATCCLAVIPYLGAVIMLPLSVFQRAYSLSYLEQFGPDWAVLSSDAKPPMPFDDLEFLP